MKSLNLKFVFVFFLSAALLLSISACSAGSSDSDSDGAASTEAPMATDAAAATEAPAAAATEAPAASGDVVPSFVFTNTGTIEICELYLSSSATDNWGPDQLGGATIPASQTFTLKNIPAGKYDAKVVGCNGAGEKTLSLDIKNP